MHISSCHDSVTPYFRNKKTSGGTRISHSLVETLLARKWLLNFLVPGNRPTNHSKRTLAPNSSFFITGLYKSISTLTLLRLRSSTKQVNLLFPFGTNVLACFHSRQDDISFQRLLDVVNLLQNTVKLRTSPMSPLCCLRRWRKMDVLPQPASPTSNTGFPPSLNKPTRWEMRCWQNETKFAVNWLANRCRTGLL